MATGPVRLDTVARKMAGSDRPRSATPVDPRREGHNRAPRGLIATARIGFDPVDSIDFFIRIRASQTEVVYSPYGTATIPFSSPCDQARAEAHLESLDSLLISIISGKTPSDSAASLLRAQQALGAELFANLFSSRAAILFAQSVAVAETLSAVHRKTAVRLRLAIESEDGELAHLAALPWELLWEPTARDFLARNNVQICRHLHTPHMQRGRLPLEVDGPLRILLVDSAPKNLRPLELAKERQGIEQALASVSGAEVEVYSQPDLGELEDRLQHRSFHILHYMGHAGFDPPTGTGTLSFVADDGTEDRVSADQLANHLRTVPSLRLVVLNACYTGSLPGRAGQRPYTSVAPALFRAGIPAVVAMQFRISEDAAVAFSRRLYSSLAEGDPVDAAVSAGRLAVYRKQPLEWATPTLFMQLGDGRIFDRPRPRTKPAGRTAPDSATAPFGPVWRLGVRTGITIHTAYWAREMDNEVDDMLVLDEYFTDHRIRDDALWRTAIFPKLREFLARAAAKPRPLHLDFAAHASVACAAGYCLAGSRGLPIEIRQRQEDGTGDWWSGDGERPDGSLWHFEEPELDGGNGEDASSMPEAGDDVALLASVSRSVLLDAEVYLASSRLNVRRLLHAQLAPEPSSFAIRNGAHADTLAHQLANKIQSELMSERRGVLHIFSAAPNAFHFFLGRRLRSAGRVQLYEYDSRSGTAGAYRPSILLTPPPADLI